jgi:hypothetical protein
MARKLYIRDFSHKKSAGFRKFIGDEKIGEIVARGKKKGELLKIFKDAIEDYSRDEGEALARAQKELRSNKYFTNSEVREIMDEAKRSGFFVSNRSVSSDKTAIPDDQTASQLSVIRPRGAYRLNRLKGKKAGLYGSGARGVGASFSRGDEGRNSQPSPAPAITIRRPKLF